MQIRAVDHYQNTEHHIEGDEDECRGHLLNLYPYLLQKYGPQCDIRTLVRDLNGSQFASASIVSSLNKSEPRRPENQGQVFPAYEQLEACREAAAFLACHTCTDLDLRQALLQEEDIELAALKAHNLPVTALPELRAILAAKSLKKNLEDTEQIKFDKVQQTNESSKNFADRIQAASDSENIEPITLKEGKHSKGVLRARDPETHQAFLLKPGSGKQNPIVGEDESKSTQSQREAAFYSVASLFDLAEYLPECHLLLLDGKEFACMRLLSLDFKNLNELKISDPGRPKRILSLYNDGTLHKWAALDYICGNPDRHSGNLMASGDKVKLIDHGSAFAGISFDPAKDGLSFVPYYLRPSVAGFTKMTTDEKLRKMPRLNAENEAKFKRWLLELNSSLLGQVIMSYGIDPAPAQIRLEKLQKATSYQSADLAILSAWTVA